MRFCPECGKEIKDTMRFCINCGADLTKHRENEARRKAELEAAAPSPFSAFTEPEKPAEAPLFPEAPAYPTAPVHEEPAPEVPASPVLVFPEVREPAGEEPKPSEITLTTAPVWTEPEAEEPEEAPADVSEPPADTPELPADVPELPADTPELPTDVPEPPADTPEPPAEVLEEDETAEQPDIPEAPEAPAYVPVYKEAIRRARDHFLYSDVRFALPAGSFDFHSDLADELADMRRVQLLDRSLWKKFVDLFKNPGVDDRDWGWRCEYWGKMMRGACYTAACSASPDDELYAVLEETIRDMLTAQDALGRFSTYSTDAEFTGWDLWGRKYILLGFLYFLDLCRDDALADEIVAALCRHADYMLSKLGRPEDGKRIIAACTSHWDGLNSCSILEPFVMLYNITHEARYFDFCEYIISFGGTLHQNLFELAYEDKIPVHEYAVTKAYEMISCFEGLAEFAKVTGNETYREAVIRFGRRILREETTIIGCLGCDYESFDHAAVEQFNAAHRGVMQETCVTATWMKFLWQLWRMTGDNAFLDALEISAYNAMSAALRRHIDPEANGGVPIPIHSYNPLRCDVRYETVGGRKNIDENSYYGCCVCISTLGFALDTLAAAGLDREGTLYVNLYQNGTVTAGDLVLTMETDYPKSGEIRVRADGFEGERRIVFRIPGWAKKAWIAMNGVKLDAAGSAAVTVTAGASFTLHFDMPVTFLTPSDAADTPTDVTNYLAVRRGPVVFALDNGNDEEVPVPLDDCLPALPADPARSDVPAKQAVSVIARGKGPVVMIDYASAGQEQGHTVSAWVRTK
ncbi:MAG: glycoside hydrolase family 127 protein [Clostridia bacterium]|nr:glycoside hydrolase family 127 protein [Clostridia bacterium]